MSENRYDVIIIGSGLGGLVCGVTLSKEGYNVCVLEKNALPGGCFQSFKRYGRVLDPVSIISGVWMKGRSCGNTLLISVSWIS